MLISTMPITYALKQIVNTNNFILYIKSNFMATKKLPKWFTVNPYTMTYEEGSNVQNPFSGESYELNGEELSMYDYIIGLQITIDRKGGALNPDSFKYQKDLRRGLDWFRRANPEAYMVLLD